MRVFALSDIHIDFEQNRKWIHNLPQNEYQDDALILAGDVTDLIPLFIEGIAALKKRFREVVYAPGNHDLWVRRNQAKDSLEQFQHLTRISADYGIRMTPLHLDSVSIIPLFGWYDYSFGMPSRELTIAWADFAACKWPEAYDEARITRHFLAMNEPVSSINNHTVISFSHFLPRIDVMPPQVPLERRTLYPVFGSSLLEQQIRQLNSTIHVYGHSHINRQLVKENILYINNALGYPYETYISARELRCVFEI